MDALEIAAAVIVGHSSHGLVAQRFAIDRPDRTLGLVLIAPPARPGDKPGLRELYDSTISKLADPIDPGFVREFAEGTTGPVPDAFLEAQLQETLKMPARVWREAFGALLQTDLAEERDTIKAPTLIVWGDQDDLVPRSEQEVVLAAIAGSQLLAYEGVGHSPHWEQPGRFASDLAAFVERLAT
jgi:pimeloyl-ACP methyl ester carboxylesterase